MSSMQSPRANVLRGLDEELHGPGGIFQQLLLHLEETAILIINQRLSKCETDGFSVIEMQFVEGPPAENINVPVRIFAPSNVLAVPEKEESNAQQPGYGIWVSVCGCLANTENSDVAAPQENGAAADSRISIRPLSILPEDRSCTLESSGSADVARRDSRGSETPAVSRSKPTCLRNLDSDCLVGVLQAFEASASSLPAYRRNNFSRVFIVRDNCKVTIWNPQSKDNFTDAEGVDTVDFKLVSCHVVADSVMVAVSTFSDAVVTERTRWGCECLANLCFDDELRKGTLTYAVLD
jgi:hypothetical protein